MKLLAFSDLHCDLDAARSLVERAQQEDFDLVVGAGDFASVHEGLGDTIDALAGLEDPLLVPGNNETEEALREAAAGIEAIVLHGESVAVATTGDRVPGEPGEPEGGVEQISVFGLGAGIPTTPWDWSFDLSDEEAAARLAECPDGIDLMVLHSPPLGHCDLSGAGDHLGSEAIRDAIEAKQPKVAVCGHIHESWGAESTIGETRVFNLGPGGRVIEV